MFQNRLRWFLSLVVLASIILPAATVGTYEIYNRFNVESQIQSQDDAQALMKVLQEALSPPLWSFIPENAQYLINGVALNPAVKRILVSDSLGEVFVEHNIAGYTENLNDIVLNDDVKRIDKTIGTISLVYSREPARDAAISYSLRLLFIIAAQVLVSLTVILMVINRRVTSPLAKLKIVAHEISEKNFDTEMPEMYDDEFSDLGFELNVMKHALKNSFENLEERVRTRTEDLTLVNHELTEAIQRLETTKDNLVQTEKLAALGALVAGVSHELNTPIGNGRLMTSALHATARELKSHYEAGDLTKSQFESLVTEILEGTTLVERNLLKAIHLVQSFKQVAVDRTSDKRRTFKLKEFLDEIESTMHHIFKSIPFELQVIPGEDVSLNSYPGVISQIISNLINNALMHAFEDREKGTISVRTKTLKHSVNISVIDDGIGMSQEIQIRILEPFFTTKLGKGGSGLGMHIVHNLATGPLGGTLQIESVAGKGSIITLKIPLTAPDSELDDDQ